jgi:hypothetical protein
MGLRPAQGDEKRLLFSNYCPRSTALPFVISTGAQRSGEICGAAAPSWKCFATVQVGGRRFPLLRSSRRGIDPVRRD